MIARCVCVCSCVRVCLRVCMFACLRACVRVCTLELNSMLLCGRARTLHVSGYMQVDRAITT
jgi:hypothetical protein